MGIDLLLPVLCCPTCRGPLQRIDRSVVCPQHHRFDLARQGYLNLLGQAPPPHADNADMVAARLRFLEAGHYAPIVTAVSKLAAQLPADSVWLEAGAGPGWYLQHLLTEHPGAVGLASDISVAAVRRAAKAHPRLAAIVSDTWQPWPLRSQSVDLVLAIFAPRNVEEFARVLRPGGLLMIVTPEPAHLASLRTAHGLLKIDAAKPDRLAASMSQGFTSTGSVTVRRDLQLTADDVRDVIAMGPNAHHPRSTTPEAISTELCVAVSGWQRIR